MLERDIKKYFLQEMHRIGALAEKFASNILRGPPDWLVTFESMYLTELKQPGGVLAPHQVRDHKRRAALGVKVWVIDSKEKVDLFAYALLLNRAFADEGLVARITCFEDLNAV